MPIRLAQTRLALRQVILSKMKSCHRLSVATVLLLLCGCASLSGPGLQPGVSTRVDIDRIMGPAAMVWSEPNGSEQRAYPTGPAGFQTWMATLDNSDRLVQIENVLDEAHFARIQTGMSQDEVLRVLGPAWPGWTVYYAARDELVWEWRYCDVFREPARFDVLFDGKSGKVRSTLSTPERLSLPWGRGNRRDWCSR